MDGGEPLVLPLLQPLLLFFFQGLGNFSIHSIEVDTGGISVEVLGCELDASTPPGEDVAV